MNEQENRTQPKKAVQRKHSGQKQASAPERRPRRAAEPERPETFRKTAAQKPRHPETAARKARRPETAVRKPQPETKRHGKLYEVLDAKTESAPTMPVRNTVLRDAVCGIILALLACIGVWTVVRQCRTYFRQKHSSDTVKEEISACILPLVLTDTDSFSEPDEIPDEAFLTASIWAFITDGGLADYPTETDLCTVPAKAILAAGNARFGTTRSLTCKTISFSGSVRFYYDAEQKAYLLPDDPKYFGYLPEIVSCSEKNGVYTVEAAYHPEQPAWYRSEAPTVRNAVFTLKKTDSAWQILSLDNGEPQAEEAEDTGSEPEETE